MAPHRRHFAPAACFAAALALYTLTASPRVLGGDNGEFATLFAERGVAHPSGYPLYTLILRALCWIPGGTAAEGAARVTALLGALAVFAWSRAARWWGATEGAALMAAGVYATASLPWRLATHAEVFTLNALLAGAIIASAGPQAPWRGTRRAVALGAFAGLALANHLSCVLLAPVGLEALLRARTEDDGRWRTLGLAPLAALPGLGTYLLIPLWARDPGDRLVWGAPTTLRALAHHVLRGDYGTTSLSSSRVAADPWAQLAWFARSLADNAAVVALVLAAAGAFVALRRAPRRPGIALLTTLLLAGPMFVSRFNIAPQAVGRAVVERFHLLPFALLVPLVALGLDALSARVALRAALRVAAGAAVLVALASRSYPSVRAAHGPEVEQYLRDSLAGVAPRAVVLCTGDQRTLGYPYLQRAQGFRRDVLVIDPWLLLVPGMAERYSARLGATIPPAVDRRVNTRALAAAVLSTGRPLYLSDPFSAAILRTFPSHPEGVMIRVRAPGEAVPPVGALIAENLARYERMTVAPAEEPIGPWQRGAREDYVRSLRSLADAAARGGRPDVADAILRRARAIAPWTVP